MRKIKSKKIRRNEITILSGNITSDNLIDIELKNISNLGTINGLNRITKIMGTNYRFENVIFSAIENDFFDEEKDKKTIEIEKCFIEISYDNMTFHNNLSKVSFYFNNSNDEDFFKGNNITFKVNENAIIRSIEFSTDSHMIDVYFDEFDFYEKLTAI